MKTGARRALAFGLLTLVASCRSTVPQKAAPEPQPTPQPVSVAPKPVSSATPTPAPTAVTVATPPPTATAIPSPPPATPRATPAAAVKPATATPAVTPRTGNLTGRLEVLGATGASPAAEAVVWVPSAPGPRSPGKPSLRQKDKRFAPHVLAVPAGAAVAFPNDDSVFHNVFSLTPGAEFDLGLYKNGASKDVTLQKPGVVRVYCNIHPKMAAYLLVVDKGPFTLTAADGTFRIPALPPGRHTVKIWHERGGEKELTIDVVAGQDARITEQLDARTFVEKPHANKYGEAYPKGNERY